jgi:CubicO group peptidase (beta-lactamase class C family)
MQNLSRFAVLALAACLAALLFPQHQTSAAPVERAMASRLGFEQPAVASIVERARSLDQLNGLIVAQYGETVLQERLRGNALDQPVNIKSVSKSIISTLVGRAIAEGLLEGVDQRVAPCSRAPFRRRPIRGWPM